MGRFVHRLVGGIMTFFLAMLAADGLLTLVDVFLGCAAGVTAFSGFRHVLAQLVFWGSILLYGLLAFMPALHRREFVIPLLTPLLLSLFLNPASLFLSRHLSMRERFVALTPTGLSELPAYLVLVVVTNLLQAAIAIWALGRLRREGDGRLAPRSFSWKRSLLFCGGHALFLAVAFVPMTFLFFGVFIASFSNEFAVLGWDGVYVIEKEYAREGKSVVLVPMVHVGDSSFYEESGRRSGSGDTIVLQEGVRDPSGRLRGVVRDNRVAHLVGLSAQQERFELSFEVRAAAEGAERGAVTTGAAEGRGEGEDGEGEGKREKEGEGEGEKGKEKGKEKEKEKSGNRGSEPRFLVQNADVDARDFRDTTVEFLELAEGVMKGMDWHPRKVARLIELCSDARQVDRVMEDLVDHRDQRLIQVLDRVLPDFQQVVIPWGFAHLGRVGRSLEKRGFTEVARRPRLVLRWRGLTLPGR